MIRNELPAPLELALAVGGPAALGLSLGVTSGAAISLPAVLLGTSALMMPALYIGSALAGAEATARDMGRATLSALRDVGIGALGLAPAVLFLSATTSSSAAAALGLAFALFLGLRGLHSRLFGAIDAGATKAKATLVFTAWALVAVGIGAHLAPF